MNTPYEYYNANVDYSTPNIYKFSNCIFKDIKYRSCILKVKFKIYNTKFFNVHFWLAVFVLLIFLKSLRSVIRTNKTWNSLLWLILSSLSRKCLMRTYTEFLCVCVAFFIFNTNINKLLNQFYINFQKKNLKHGKFQPKMEFIWENYKQQKKRDRMEIWTPH